MKGKKKSKSIQLIEQYNDQCYTTNIVYGAH